MFVLMIYAVLGTLLLPLALLVALVGGLFKRGWWDDLPARFGFPPESENGRPIVVWCASVGEVNTAQRLIRALLGFGPVVIATITPSGLHRARELFGASATVTLAPLDIMLCALRWIKRVDPRLIVLFETELWPLTLRIAHDHDARLALVNGRLSDRSYPGYWRLRWLIRPLLSRFDLVAAQTEPFAQRFIALGAPAERTRVLGSLKFDLDAATPIDAQAEALYRAFAASRRVVVAGSTHPGEEALLARTFIELRGEFPQLGLIVAPRHIKRADEVEEELRACGLRVVRRSAATASADADVLLLDTMGELTWAYQLAEIAFVGGSFTSAGGHNVLEPAIYGAPVVVGPLTPNFRMEVDALREAGALAVCRDAAELPAVLRTLLSDDQRRHQMGEAGAVTVRNHQGAAARTAAAIQELLPPWENSAG